MNADSSLLNFTHFIVSLFEQARDVCAVVPTHDYMTQIEYQSDWVRGGTRVDKVINGRNPEYSAQEIYDAVAKLIVVVGFSVSQAHAFKDFPTIHLDIRSLAWKQVDSQRSIVMLEVSDREIHRYGKEMMQQVA